MGELEIGGDIGQVEVIVGTYEEFILGYKLAIDPENEKYSLSMSFTNHSQSKSIRAVSTVGKYLAAGSADESINLINMDARVEHGSLQEQNGTITCLTEHKGNHLFSGCDDGTICIWKKGSWLCEKTLRAHTGGVIDVSVHPSGTMALSIGKDKALKTWNLVKGRCGYVTNLKCVADVVRWSPEGTYYAVSLSNRVDVYILQTAKVVYSANVGKRISCISFIDESVMVIAGDKESVEVHDIQQGKKLCEFNCHKVRVKAIKYVPELGILFTASNDGFIKLWKFKKDKYSKPKPPRLLTELDTTCRVTCMTVWVKPVEGAGENGKDEVMEMEDDVEKEVDTEVGDDQVEEDSEDLEDEEDSEDMDEDDDEDLEEDEDEGSSDSEEEVQMAKKRRKLEIPKKDDKSKIKNKGSPTLNPKTNAGGTVQKPLKKQKDSEMVTVKAKSKKLRSN